MSSIKRAITRVVSIHSRGSSKSSSTNSDTPPFSNGHAEKVVKYASFDDTNAPGMTAAQKQQADDTQGRDSQRPNSVGHARKMSFTEQKEERRMEREMKEEQEARQRRQRLLEAHDQVCCSMDSFQLPVDTQKHSLGSS